MNLLKTIKTNDNFLFCIGIFGIALFLAVPHFLNIHNYNETKQSFIITVMIFGSAFSTKFVVDKLFYILVNGSFLIIVLFYTILNIAVALSVSTFDIYMFKMSYFMFLFLLFFAYKSFRS